MVVKLTCTLKADAVKAKMARGSTINEVLPDAMKKGVLYTLGTVPGYPAPPDTSTYVRTGLLGRSITSLQGQAEGSLARVEPLGAHVIGYIGSSVEYAGYVVDENQQAWMHQGRWFTLQSVVAKAIDNVVKILHDAIMEHLG